MSLVYYGINPTGGPDSVAISVGSTTSRHIEVVVNNAVIRTEDEVSAALDKILVALQQKRLNLS